MEPQLRIKLHGHDGLILGLKFYCEQQEQFCTSQLHITEMVTHPYPVILAQSENKGEVCGIQAVLDPMRKQKLLIYLGDF